LETNNNQLPRAHNVKDFKSCRILCRFLLVVILLSVLSASPCYSSVTDIWCTSPWVSILANFVGGIHVSVHSMRDWDDNGVDIPVISAENVPPSSFIIALDISEAEKCGIEKQNYPGLTTLYSKVPVAGNNLKSIFYDPSTLPFIALRVMNALSGYDPVNYAYYQRRLAEFQTRLDSTVIVGRQLLHGTHIMLFNMDISELFVAAGCHIDPLPAKLMPFPLLEKKKKGSRAYKEKKKHYEQAINEFVHYLGNKMEEGIIPVIDLRTPKDVREALLASGVAVILPHPSLNVEFILFLNDHYLALWNELRLSRH